MKRLISIFVAIICLLPSTFVNAASISEVYVLAEDREYGEIVISAEIVGGIDNSLVSVILCNDEVTSLTSNVGNLLPNIKCVAECVVVNGKIDISMFLGEEVPTDYYAVFISGEQFDTVREEFYYVSPFAAKLKLKELNEKTTWESFKTTFFEYCDLVELDYSKISETGFNQDNFFKKLFTSKPAAGFETHNDLVDYFKACYHMQVIEQKELSADRRSYLMANHSEMKIDASEFISLGEVVQLKICEKISPELLVTPLIFQNFLNESAVICPFETATVWNTFEETIEKHSDVFVLDEDAISKFSKIKDKEKVFKYMFENRPEVYTIENINALYNSAIEKRYEDENKKAPSGGGGASTISIDKTPDKDNEEKKPETAPENNISETANVFSDLEGVDWAKEAIQYLYSKGIVSGVGEGKFLPNNNVTREEFVKLVVEAFKLEISLNKSSFSDVDTQAWYADYISAAVNCGIINGIDETNFGVGQPISRQDMVTILYRVINAKGVNLTDSSDVIFADAEKIAPYALDAVKLMAGNGIVNGVSANEFSPDTFATRAQSAKIIYNVLLKNID